MKKYTMPKVVIKALSSGDIVTLSGFNPGENETPLQPIGSSSGLTSVTNSLNEN